jgi:hypothetical protein
MLLGIWKAQLVVVLGWRLGWQYLVVVFMISFLFIYLVSFLILVLRKADVTLVGLSWSR